MFNNIKQPEIDVQRFRSALIETPVGTLDVLGATFEETLYYNPASALNRYFTLEAAKDNGQRLQQKDWEISEYYRDGIEVGPEGITTGEAALLAENYDRRQEIRFTLDRAGGGYRNFGEGVAQFGVSLVGSVLDPLNIGASFIPVIGAANFASLASRVGVRRARDIMRAKKRYTAAGVLPRKDLTAGQMVTRGAVEGGFGAVVVEPIVLAAAEAEQDKDYTIMDSLMNVAFGTVLGGGLHVAAGSLSNKLRRAKEETRRNLLSVALAQAVEGRRIDVEDIALTDPALRNEPSRPMSPETRRVIDEVQDGEAVMETTVTVNGKTKTTKRRRLESDSLKILDPENEGRPKSLTQWVIENARIAKDTSDNRIKQIFGKEVSDRMLKKDGMSIEDAALAAQEAGYFPNKSGAGAERVTVDEFLQALNDDQASNGRVFSVFDDDKAYALGQAEKLLDEATKLGVLPYYKTDDELFEAIRIAREERGLSTPSKNPVSEGLTKEEFDRTVDKANAELSGFGDLEDYRPILNEADEVDKTYKDPELEDIREQIDELDTQIAALTEFDNLPEEYAEGIIEADELVERANSFEAAARAGAACLNRRRGG